MPKMARTREQMQFDEVSDKLHGIKKRSGYTQQDIADLTGWSKSKVGWILDNPSRAKTSDIRKLAFICGYSFDLVFDEIEKAPEHR